MKLIKELITKIFNKIINFEKFKTDINKIKINQGKLLCNELNNCTLENLDKYSFSIFSQFNEDGIIQFLISNLDIKNHSFIEIGVENYEEANTRFLLENNCWQGTIIDSSSENVSYIKKQNYYWRYNLKVKDAFVTKENINEIIKTDYQYQNVGLLSIDIDGNDYWIWDSINNIKPDILVIEYNSLFGPDESLSLKYDKNFIRPQMGIFRCLYGASLQALTKLSIKKGYSLVAVNSNGNNAFFVKNELLNDKIYKRDVKQCYKKNTFKEYINSKNEIGLLNNDELTELLASKKITKV